MDKICQHDQFIADVKVHRLQEVENGPVTGYSADIKIHCSLCGQPFKFVGVSAGYSNILPKTNVEFTELRAPLIPSVGQLVKSNSKAVN